jgi:hypothetical protein
VEGAIMTNTVELENALAHFTGSEEWFKHLSGLLYTSGVQYLAENAGAYWLIDAIASWQVKARKESRLRDFQLWTLEVADDKTAILTCHYDQDDPAFNQKIPYTDFPIKSIRLYVQNGTILLPSEY